VPRRLAVLVLLALVPFARGQELLTVAEKTDYKATSRHADVLAFCDELVKRSPVVRRIDMGKSVEGRPLPLLILADPPVSTPAEAAKSGKLVAYVQANIHAGEVDGKEALLMLAREIATAKERPLLKDLVILLCPNFNPDGNEKFDANNRRSQNGPPEVGVRANAAGLDLNRDFVKLESPEVRAFVRMMNEWDPALVIDCHTTNGSYHRYTLTYDGPRHPNTGPALVEAIRDRMLPAVSKTMKERTGFDSFVYGNFSRDHARWTTYGHTPRYSTQYVGMRGKIGILSESYSYAPFKDRVTASREFVRAWLEYVAAHKDEVRKLLAENKQGDTLAVRTESAVLKKVTALGYEEETKNGRRVAITDKPRDYDLELVTRVEPTERVTKPFAYLFLPSFAAAVEILQRHGITVEELREDIELDVESYRVEKIVNTERSFQGPAQVSLDVAKPRAESRRVTAGTILVRTAQPLGTLASYLLEPRSEDGLATWKYFDAGLAENRDFSVLRLPKATPLTAGPVRPLAEIRPKNNPINAAAVYDVDPHLSFAGDAVTIQDWLDDEHFLQAKEGRLYKIEARTGRASLFVDPQKLSKSLAAVPGLEQDLKSQGTHGGRRRRGRADDAPDYKMDPHHTGALLEHEDDLYFARFDGTPAVRLTRSPGKKEAVTFSPDGKFIAYVRKANLYVVELANPAERALTTDGGGPILNAKADWVYLEEVFNREDHSFVWSPDSRWIAFLRYDDTPVHKFAVVNHIPTRLDVESIPYPKAGDPNPVATLHVVSAAGGEAVPMDLSNYSPSESIVTRFGWLPDSSRVYCYMQNRAQTWLDICTAPARGGPTTRLLRETTKAFVADPGAPTFLPDGTFLLSSERTGWEHRYHYDATGRLIRPVTSGDWEARTVHHVDAKGGWAYVSGTKDSPIAENLYRVKLDGSEVQRLTQGPGEHQIKMNPGATMYVETVSDRATPAQVRLCRNDGYFIRTLDTNPVHSREEYRFGKYELVQIKLSDGFVLEGAITYPPDFDPAKKYPVWFMTYGGPHAPTVSDNWAGGRVYEQVLADLGIVCFRCDPRSASGKGACSTWACYRKLGVQEAKDVDEAIDWLCRNPWVDTKRIGMAGHSYGGFLTAFCLTHSKKFAAGISGAPVTDWRNYDTIYTERLMNTPQENPDGYESTSVVKAAKDLHGRLLLLHGLMDDNVHPQNTIQLMKELQKHNKEFEVMFYPESRHRLEGLHYERLTLEFIKKTMGVGK
jgi:YD repeat-containing protein